MVSEMAPPLEMGRDGDKVLFTLDFIEFTGSSGTRTKFISKN